MIYTGKKAAIIGFGITGKAVASFLRSRDCAVHIYESKKKSYFTEEDFHRYPDVSFFFETNDFDVSVYDFIVTSPGASTEISPIQKAFSAHIPVYNDVTLFIEEWRRIGHGNIVGVTGSNGKTTTVSLLYEAIKNVAPAILAGNIGNSPLDILDITYPNNVVVVLELSSNQLDLFQPQHYLDVCVLLNLSSNHLDRYGGSMEKYGASKLRGIDSTKTQTILCVDDPGTKDFILPQITSNHISVVSFETPLDRVDKEGMYTDSDSNLVFCTIQNKNISTEIVFPETNDRNLIGIHNLYNIACILLAIKKVGLPITEKVIHTIRTFIGLEHRIEKVREKDGVLYINDSKSTSPDSIRVALEAVSSERNVILIAGGDDKDMSFAYLRPFFAQSVKALVVMPGDIEKKLISVAIDADVPVHNVTTLAEAVRLTDTLAESGDVVLLSPGSYSKNYFKDFTDRGNQFKAFVRAL